MSDDLLAACAASWWQRIPLFLKGSEILLILFVVITYDDMITKHQNNHDESCMNHDDMI